MRGQGLVLALIFHVVLRGAVGCALYAHRLEERGTIKKGSSYTEDVVGVTGLDDAIGVLAAEVDHFGVVEVVQVVAGHDQEFAETCQR